MVLVIITSLVWNPSINLIHLTAVEKEEEEQVVKLGSNYNQKKITVPSDALIRKSIKNMSSIEEDEQDKLKRQTEVLYYLAANDYPYIDFHGLGELEKMHVIKCLKAKCYRNETVCNDLMQNVTWCLFQEDLGS